MPAAVIAALKLPNWPQTTFADGQWSDSKRSARQC